MTSTTKRTKPLKATLTVKFIKEANYDSKLFKICEGAKSKATERFVKEWDNEQFIYLKNKYLDCNVGELELLKFYKMRLYVESFTNDEGKLITYISKTKYISVDYHEKPTMNTGSDSDWE